jgi:hypothetical protein
MFYLKFIKIVPVVFAPGVRKIFIVLLCVAVFACASSLVCGQKKSSGKIRLPRVGAIRNDEKTGESKPGCGNHYLYRTRYAEKAVFLSDDDGFNAWMNLDGHNVELKLVKTTLYPRDRFEAFASYEYRFRNIRIAVSLIQYTDYTVWIPAKIIIRKGRGARTIKTFVTPQCD